MHFGRVVVVKMIHRAAAKTWARRVRHLNRGRLVRADGDFGPRASASASAAASAAAVGTVPVVSADVVCTASVVVAIGVQ